MRLENLRDMIIKGRQIYWVYIIIKAEENEGKSIFDGGWVYAR